MDHSQVGHSQGSMKKSGQGETAILPARSQDSERSRVHISVKRLREVPAPFPDFVLKKRDPRYVPPALPANKYPAVKFTLMDGPPGAMNGSTIQKNATTKNDSSSPRVLVTKHFQDITDEKAVIKKTQEGSLQKSKDVQISQFATGQKETFLAALNKRVQSGPVTKEVRVQLLEDASDKGKKTTSTTERHPNCSDIYPAAIAAATAAAIAAAAPVLKAQSDLEAQVNYVSQVVNKLQATDRQLHRLTEQQSRIQSQPAERSYHPERVSELERQLTQLTEQRLQHLERLQQQQLEMQSQFMNSAIKASTSHQEPAAPVCTHVPLGVSKQPFNLPGKTAPPKNVEKVAAPTMAEITHHSGKSPLETPAPRRFAPVPISMDVQVPSKTLPGKERAEESKNLVNSGQGHFLQQILGHDGTPLSRSTYKSHTPLNLTTADSRPFNDRFLRSDGVSGANTSQSRDLSSSTAVQKADDVLKDLNELKQEMRNMMMDAKQWKSQVDELKPRMQPVMPSTSLYKHHSFRRSAVNPPKSMFEDAERVLREVQNNKKVLEDNLDAIIRAKDGAAIYSLINTLATNSHGAEKIRIQKTVDSWIAEISSEIQDELAKKDYKKKKSDDRVQESALRRNAGSGKDMKNNNRDQDIKAPARGALRSTKPLAGVSAKTQCKQSGEKLTGLHRGVLQKKDGGSKVSQKVNESSLMDEEVLNRVYGTPAYQGHRSTLKKGPYLRFSSPSPKSKPRRPKVLETVRGVKLKSAKIQTSSPELERAVIKSPEFTVPKDYGPQYVFSPSREIRTSSLPMEGHLIPMAIPLGRTRFDGAAPLPSSVMLARPQSVTVNVSIPPTSPKPQANVVKPNVALVEMRSEKKNPPQLSVQVLPCVDIDSIVSESPLTSHRAPSPDPQPRTPSPVKTDIQLPVDVETEEEILALPGSSFNVPDFSQEDQVDEVPEPLLELNGWGETNPPTHGGIPFPPPAPAPQTNTDILDGIITRKETLENRLVCWVEQEIMARVISEMHAVRQDAVPDITLSSSENSESASSDIVETAGGEGLQLFVDAGVPVDSSLIRKYVNEALTETVAIMLGERETQRAPAPLPKQPNIQPVSVEIPPVPTPQCTPPSSPLPPKREPSIVQTPEISPQTSLEEPKLQQEEPEDGGQMIPLSHVDTPTITPVASPPRVNTPTPLISEDDEEPSPTSKPWGDMELPLEEEHPHSIKEAVQYKNAVVMTVAEEDEPRSLISANTPEVEKSIPIPPKQRTPSPIPSSPSSAPSTDESSLTVTESDTTDKPISEGEVLYSYGQIVAARAFAEGGLLYPNLTESLSSTLKDAHDMEFDPPSEGQVIHGPHRGAHRDPVLSLLAKFNQDPVAPHEAFYHPESSGDENSMGEISEGQRPRLTTAAEQVLVGHSAFMDRPTNTGQTAGHTTKRPSSPGQYMNIPGISHGDADNISSGPMSVGDLQSQLLPVHYPHAEDFHQIPAATRNTSQGPGEPQKKHQPVPTRFIQVGVKSSDGPHQGIQEDSDRTLVEPSVYLSSVFSGEAPQPSKKMSVTLPSMREAEEPIKSTFTESDSSGADTF